MTALRVVGTMSRITIAAMLSGCVAYTGTSANTGPSGAYHRAHRAPYVVQPGGDVVVTEALSPAAAEAVDHCSHIAPICHVGQEPICVCTTPSLFSCGWMCVSDPH